MATSPSDRTPATPLADVLVHALHHRTKAVVRAHARCLRALSEENVHRLRLAARHLLPVLEVWSAWTEGSKRVRKAEHGTRRVLGLIGPLRDAQVQLNAVRERSAKDKALAPLLRSALQEVQARKKEVHDRLAAFSTAPLIALSAKAKKKHPAASPHLVLLNRVSHRRARLVRKWSAMEAGTPRTLHRARIALKKYRYLIDAFADVLPAATVAEQPFLKRLQQRLGHLHDEGLTIGHLRRWSQALKAAPRAGTTAYVERSAALHARRAAAFLHQQGRALERTRSAGRS